MLTKERGERERERVSLEGVALSTASISVSSPQHLSILVREMTGTEDAAPHEGTQAGRGILANFDSVISKRLRPLFFLSPLGCHNAQGSCDRGGARGLISPSAPPPRARPKLAHLLNGGARDDPPVEIAAAIPGAENGRRGRKSLR